MDECQEGMMRKYLQDYFGNLLKELIQLAPGLMASENLLQFPVGLHIDDQSSNFTLGTVVYRHNNGSTISSNPSVAGNFQSKEIFQLLQGQLQVGTWGRHRSSH